MALKLRQYQQGERFLRRISEVGGQPALDRVWMGAKDMPGWSEVRRPELWLRRLGYLPPLGSGTPSPQPA